MSACCTTISQEVQVTTLDFNEHLIKWGEANGIHIIKTASTFMFSIDEVDDICFDTEINSCLVLNRPGVIKFLATILKSNAKTSTSAQTKKKSRKIITPIKHNDMEEDIWVMTALH